MGNIIFESNLGRRPLSSRSIESGEQGVAENCFCLTIELALARANKIVLNR